MAIVSSARNVRVYIGDRDISRMVRAISIQASVGEVTRTTLELIVTPTITPGLNGEVVMNLDPPPTQGHMQSLSGPARAVRLRVEEDLTDEAEAEHS